MKDRLRLLGIIVLLSHIIGCFPPSWIRELPERPESSNDIVLKGIYNKNLPPFSPLTSVTYKENQTERLEFSHSEKTFQKYYFREIEEKGEIRRIKIEGTGQYESRGNWLLLETRKIKKEESVWKDGKQISGPEINFLETSHKLLYHYDPSNDSLIPMIYESGYREKPFGVVEGTNSPYAEDEFFRIARRNYSKKEYQGHAYFKVK
ncbi:MULTISPECIES: hypothetical protein [unclassified Leptospira]|uniref:hypothetical protein n=1 Tax=unclassified Leptospira TaxID=2633828 RepID=UPI0002BD364F|nr:MULTISPECIES: hypothetical protein [unclassified Leptospira]EMK01893.1 hypothetical protein LEP1GSC192_1522 [Leptospira sp. B5-022]MCR1794331.1 hypothetical protein [Leptospira sp. id769339]